MIRRIGILLVHDLAVAFKNKVIFLVICIPLLVYTILILLDPMKSDGARLKIALPKSDSYFPGMIESIYSQSELFEVHWAASEREATQWLGQREVDGVLLPLGASVPQLRLLVIRLSSIETLAIRCQLSALQIATECKTANWLVDIHPLQTSSIQQQTLSTWILMMVLLVCFIVLPAQIAEEKEKQLFVGWMQTPLRESEWLVAKLAYAIILILLAVLLLHLTNLQFAFMHAIHYAVMLGTGGFCFGSLGVCLGLLCRSQASARSLGVLCYLPLLLPAALSDMSLELRQLAPWLPSYYFYEPMRAIILDQASLINFMPELLILAVMGILASMIAYKLMRKRWMM